LAAHLRDSDALNAELSAQRSVQDHELIQLRNHAKDLHTQLDLMRDAAETHKSAAPEETVVRPEMRRTHTSDCDPVTDRDLHVITIHDNGPDGKRLPALGRVFITARKCTTILGYFLRSKNFSSV